MSYLRTPFHPRNTHVDCSVIEELPTSREELKAWGGIRSLIG